MQETGVPSLTREDPLEKEMATHTSILARGTWRATVHGVVKESDRLSNETINTVFIKYTCLKKLLVIPPASNTHG